MLNDDEAAALERKIVEFHERAFERGRYANALSPVEEKQLDEYRHAQMATLLQLLKNLNLTKIVDAVECLEGEGMVFGDWATKARAELNRAIVAVTLTGISAFRASGIEPQLSEGVDGISPSKATSPVAPDEEDQG